MNNNKQWYYSSPGKKDELDKHGESTFEKFNLTISDTLACQPGHWVNTEHTTTCFGSGLTEKKGEKSRNSHSRYVVTTVPFFFVHTESDYVALTKMQSFCDRI